jgi:hypothetical protein
MKLTNMAALVLTVSAMLIGLIPATAFGKAELPSPDLFDDYDIQQSPNKVLPKKAVKGKNRSVNVHTDLLWSDSLTLNLFNDVVVTAVRDRLIDKVKGHTTWIGHVEGEQDSEVFLTVRGKTMSGNVQIGDKTYEIEFKGNNKHDITQVDPDKNPKHSHSKQPEDFLAAGGEIDSTMTLTAPTTSNPAAGTIIDVLVVYTARAKNNASGQAGIEAKISNAVAMANQAYINSKIDMQINLIAMKETNYVETGNMSTSLSDLTGTSDGKMDEVHTWRNQYGADQVALVSADANYCGIGYMMTGSWISSAFASYAFSVVHDDSAYACLSNQTLAHEMGHNQGDQHNKEDSSGTAGAYSYSYGYRLCQTGGFRTVMSYNCTGGARVSYFSNPNVMLSTTEVTGSSTANNALSMNNTKGIVAAFRSAVDTTLPNAPGNLTATAVSDSAITLAWADNSGNETGFRIERSFNGVNWAEVAVVGSNSISFNNTGLSAATTYFYRVRAYNSNGFSPYSNAGSALTGSAVCTRNTPALTLAPSSIYSKTGAAINFSISLTNKDTSACGITTFTLTNSDGATLGSYSLSPAGSASANWSLTAPSVDGSYTKSVTSSAAGHSNATASAAIIVDGTAPSAPGSLTASIVKRTQVALAWQASTDTGSGIARYDILRNTTKVASITTTKYTDKPPVKGTYTYTVQAFDKAGNFKGSAAMVAVGDNSPRK